jgi:hypothetical protein
VRHNMIFVLLDFNINNAPPIFLPAFLKRKDEKYSNLVTFFIGFSLKSY